jgi:hypothetical protein
LYILAGIMGLAVGLPFYCGCLPLGWMMAAALQEGQFFYNDNGGVLLWIGMCGICAVSLSIVPLSIFIIVLGAARHEAILTSETFTFGLHGWTRTLRLSEIVRVSVRYYYPFNLYPWGVNLTNTNGRIIFIPIARWAMLKVDNNIFDYRKMLSDILQRLPSTAAVEEGVTNIYRLREFPVVTGGYSRSGFTPKTNRPSHCEGRFECIGILQRVPPPASGQGYI